MGRLCHSLPDIMVGAAGLSGLTMTDQVHTAAGEGRQAAPFPLFSWASPSQPGREVLSWLQVTLNIMAIWHSPCISPPSSQSLSCFAP